MISNIPEPLYYAVIFTSVLKAESKEYEILATEMLELDRLHPGFLGLESS